MQTKLCQRKKLLKKKSILSIFHGTTFKKYENPLEKIFRKKTQGKNFQIVCVPPERGAKWKKQGMEALFGPPPGGFLLLWGENKISFFFWFWGKKKALIKKKKWKKKPK